MAFFWFVTNSSTAKHNLFRADSCFPINSHHTLIFVLSLVNGKTIFTLSNNGYHVELFACQDLEKFQKEIAKINQSINQTSNSQLFQLVSLLRIYKMLTSRKPLTTALLFTLVQPFEIHTSCLSLHLSYLTLQFLQLHLLTS